MSQHWKTVEDMMASKEWAMTDKAGRTKMMQEHGFAGQQKGAMMSPKRAGKSPYRPGAVGQAQRMVQRPMGLDRLTEALNQGQKNEEEEY